ncbi:hypothetical protein RO3G_17048 [Rhizopus delemar RA 99-880]|uniref:Tc1-like transposase DDE domain-containing protein n=1 Tax=Rhizopus delemar (strain RA 99-880 / ATCC MYA-4621 / FGSC 9543 / NRRL 43880) TaxID=246409 RepID=I1CUW1_RHIO9|nr:hypothetical protein RO3G_17048 [Rhizopus delemar RA 99-880]|eukprot:EIE92241.1 hypothetical protein RO3G_17048 [Rhizopus delemar RA 99-880]
MTLDEMDKHPHMKGYYVVMDNAPIHTHENIKNVDINICTMRMAKCSQPYADG